MSKVHKSGKVAGRSAPGADKTTRRITLPMPINQKPKRTMNHPLHALPSRPSFTLWLALSLLLPSAARAETLVGGTIANQNWTKDKSPYLVTNDVYVSGSLTIREGVEVRFEGNYLFEAAGRLRAVGTADEPVHFHPADTNVGWQGILFRDAVPGSYFVHTIIEGSKNSGLRITNTPPALTNCVIRNNTSPGNGAGILAVVSGTPLVMHECFVTNNVAGPYGSGDIRGGGIAVNGASVFISCDIAGNRTQGSLGVGGGIYATSGNCTIMNSRIVGNLAGGTSRHYASGIEVDDGQLFMANSKILDNGIKNAAGDTGGLRCVGSIGRLLNSVFARNASYGIGLHGNSSLQLVNCNILASERQGLGVWNGTVAITNCVVFFNNNNGDQLGGGLPVGYSDVQGGYPGQGNVSWSPSLCPDTFALLAGSPCIDAGHPGLEFRDSVLSADDCSPYARGTVRNDMGAYGGPGVAYWTQPRAEPVIRLAPDNTIGFRSQPVALHVLATGQDILNYQWFRDGAPLAGQTNALLTIPAAALGDVGAYVVEVRNDLGSVTSATVRLGVAQLEAVTEPLDQGRPRLRVRHGQAGEKCAIYSRGALPPGEGLTVPGAGAAAWELRATVDFATSEATWTDPRPLAAGEARYYGVLPAP